MVALHRVGDNMETEEHSQAEAESQTGKRSFRTRKMTTTTDLIMSEEHVMPTFCSAQNCGTWSSTDNKYKIFPFPQCKVSAKKWRKLLNLTRVGKLNGVCELHFDKKFLIRKNKGTIVALKAGAVPTKFQGPNKSMVSTIRCRMCGLSMKYLMTNTVSELQMDHRLRPVLEMCLELNNSKHSFLPDTVCDRCTKMVRFVGEFAETCWDAQQQLLSLYAGTRKPLSQNLEDTEETLVMHTESSDSAPSEQEVFLITHEQDSEMDYEGAPQEYSVDFDPDKNTSRLISVEGESLNYCNSINNDTMGTLVIHTETSDISLSEHKLLTVYEQDSELESQELPIESDHKLLTVNEQDSEIESQERPTEFDHDSNTSGLVSIKAEPSDYGNHEPPQKIFKPSGNQIDMASGRFKKYECEICWQRLTSQLELKMHIRKHECERTEGKSSGEAAPTGWYIENIKCLQCRKTFETTEELKAHTAQEHKFEVYCPVCGMRFRDKEALEQHRKRVRRCMAHDTGRKK